MRFEGNRFLQNADISDMLMDRAVLNEANLKYASAPMS